MKNANSDIMQYLDGMERTSHEILDSVDRLYSSYDYKKYTRQDVSIALSKEVLSLEDYAALLSPVAGEFLEQMAAKAKMETAKHFGNSVGVYTPLYLANYCENQCVYCGFNCKNKIHRAALNEEEIDQELSAIAKQGFKEILLLTGESRTKSSVEYIGKAIAIAKKYFATIGIEIYPVNSDEYAYLHKMGADYVSVYQETYCKEKYAEQHILGAKRVFPYRFNAQERALIGGMRGVCFGALLGLDDWRKDAFAVGCHAYFVQKKYPHAEISFSCPRIRPYINNSESNANGVGERQLLQVLLAYRLLMPFATINISTREKISFRDGVVGMVCNKISAGSKVGVGGHTGEEKGDEQFDISDPRGLEEVLKMLNEKGLQAVFTDSQYLVD